MREGCDVHRSFMTFFVVIFMFLCGCALNRPYEPPAPALSSELRSKLGNVGVISTVPKPSIYYYAPRANEWSSAAAQGAGKGAVAVAEATGVFNFPVGGHRDSLDVVASAAALVIAVPVGAVVGGIYGMMDSVSADKIVAAERSLECALVDAKFGETLRDRIVYLAGERYMKLAPLKRDNQDEVYDYALLAMQGIDTVLKVSAYAVELWNPGGKNNPPLSFHATTEVRIVRTSDQTDLYIGQFQYSGTSERFASWGRNNGQAFREQLDRASQLIAEQVVTKLFLEEPSSSEPIGEHDLCPTGSAAFNE
jgi:hypothetical protein